MLSLVMISSHVILLTSVRLIDAVVVRRELWWNFRYLELSLHGTFIPWNFRPLELSLPRAKITWNFRSPTRIISDLYRLYKKAFDKVPDDRLISKLDSTWGQT